MNKPFKNRIIQASCIIMALIFTECARQGCDPAISDIKREPAIFPDYSGVVVPGNISPLNFNIREKGKSFKIRLRNADGSVKSFKSHSAQIRFARRMWNDVLAKNHGKRLEIEISAFLDCDSIIRYSPLSVYISEESIDPYLCYRTLYPGYETWGDMEIILRSLGDFRERSLLENQLLEGNCVNCHTSLNSEEYFVHIRGSNAGTYFTDKGQITRKELRTSEMPGNAVYPAWHPDGRFIVFSSNMIFSLIHMKHDNNIDMYDRFSILTLFDNEKNVMSACHKDNLKDYMDTYPVWDSEGRYLYFCRAPQINTGFKLDQIKYDIVRMPFDKNSGSFGETEMVFDAGRLGKSASLPSISPDGRNLVFTLHNHGSVPNFHSESDLYLLKLGDHQILKLELNSDETESYTSWSSNGHWLVFSSKRNDGHTSQPYLAYFESPDSTGKPFLLPQNDPAVYQRSEKTFNRPELVKNKIRTRPRQYMRAARKEPVQAVWIDAVNDSIP